MPEIYCLQNVQYQMHMEIYSTSFSAGLTRNEAAETDV